LTNIGVRLIIATSENVEGELHVTVKQFKLRPITAADDAQMAAILRADLEEGGYNLPGTAYFDPQVDHLTAFYAKQTQPAAYWVLSDDAGTVYGGAGVGPYATDTAELQKLYIRADARGLGGGKQLIMQCIAFARQHYEQLYLETFKTMTAANHLYDAFGFKQLDAPLPGSEHSACDAWRLMNL
jgi:putative acetyltransferase